MSEMIERRFHASLIFVQKLWVYAQPLRFAQRFWALGIPKAGPIPILWQVILEVQLLYYNIGLLHYWFLNDE